jgi:hypothetical protein
VKSPRPALLPVLSDVKALRLRLEREEQQLLRSLSEGEGMLRRFEELDRPAYETWLRLEFGPKLSWIEEILASIRVKQLLIQRIQGLTEDHGFHPREALHLASADLEAVPAEADATPGAQTRADFKDSRPWDSDEIEARRRAKLEAKREARRETKRQQKIEKNREKQTSARAPGDSGILPNDGIPSQRKRVNLYRRLARRLHPDSPGVTSTETTQRLWLEVQAAYDAGDDERLLAVAAWLGADSHDENGAPSELALTLSERMERLRMLTRSATRLAKELEKRSSHPAWAFTDRQSELRPLRRNAAREIDGELARLQDTLSSLEDFIDSIGPPRAPSRSPSSPRGKRR